ncbi:MAG: NAD-binding oxidoreductase, partial [bacterium]
MMRLFSSKHRPFHLGPYPLERLKRRAATPDLERLPPMRALSFDDPNPASLAHAMKRFMGMFDVVRDGTLGPEGEIPDDPRERSNHLKGAGYYFDATMVGVCALAEGARLATPIRNPMVGEIAAELERSVPKSFAAGMDMILADVKDSAKKKLEPIDRHTHALVFLVEYARDPRPGEPGTEWLSGTQAQRAAVLAAQTAVLLSTYLRMLGFEARAHSATTSEVDLGKLAIAAGLVELAEEGGGLALSNPYVGTRFGLAALTTTLELAPDLPLAERGAFDRLHSHGPAWWLGMGTPKGA